jgi:exosortase C (VPDSG-CTERM-specific)
LWAFGLATAVLVLGFSRPLYDLMRFAAGSQLYSYILLIPLISLYLIWLRRQKLPRPSEPAYKFPASALLAGSVGLVGYWLMARSSSRLALVDSLALTTCSFLLFLLGAGFLFLGQETLRPIAFPIAFLFFMSPLPASLRDWIEVFLQHTSAVAADMLFRLSSTPVFRDNLAFQLPGLSLQVAPECSGLHSSLVLFITSLLAGYLFLRAPWKRAALTLAVLPLAILRNGLRIFAIGQLCVHISPEMIHSAFHRHGGPLFFVLSLMPLLLLLVVLQKSDRATKTPMPKHHGV